MLTEKKRDVGLLTSATAQDVAPHLGDCETRVVMQRCYWTGFGVAFWGEMWSEMWSEIRVVSRCSTRSSESEGAFGVGPAKGIL
jgi:hypothetical protein